MDMASFLREMTASLGLHKEMEAFLRASDVFRVQSRYCRGSLVANYPTLRKLVDFVADTDRSCAYTGLLPNNYLEVHKPAGYLK